MPRFSVFGVEFSFDVLGDVRVVARAETLQRLDGAHHRHLRHLGVHIVALDPDAAVRILPVDVQRVPIVARNDDCLRAVGPAHAIGLNLSCNNFDHVFV